MRVTFFLMLFTLCLTSSVQAKIYKVTSPDKKTEVTITADKGIIWSMTYDGIAVTGPCYAAMELNDRMIPSAGSKVTRALVTSEDKEIRPVVARKNSVIPDVYNQLTLRFSDGNSIIFRVYNDGVAYRFSTTLPGSITVRNELFSISLPDSCETWYPSEKSMMSHNERIFIHGIMDTIGEDHLASLPALFKPNGINMLVTESDIYDYPGMWIRGDGKGGLTGVHPGYPDREELRRDRNMYVMTTKDYIANTTGSRSFPWRVFVISPDDAGLVASEMVFKLAEPCRINDVSWIKPGKVAWDWWNANNIYGVDFRAGLNNETYKYYIDFAAENRLEYVILDEGWYNLGDVLDVAPGFDIKELCDYAASKNVGIILWVVWKSLYDKIDEALTQYEKWGVKGIKVDFMQRDDQWMVNYYHEVAMKAASHHLLVDFHGSYKPDGMERTWPNALTREGVKGLENNKWSKDVTPEHDVTLPFTRMVAGPMDYTPGAMVNMQKRDFEPMFYRPASQGTRVHQMAMYVVYESPLMMLADSPTNYRKEQECTTFISLVPVTWDETRVLAAKTGEYLVVARRKGSEWYVGAMTNWTPRTLMVELPFENNSEYMVESFADGINADNHAQDYLHLTKMPLKDNMIEIKMAPGGGWVARISEK